MHVDVPMFTSAVRVAKQLVTTVTRAMVRAQRVGTIVLARVYHLALVHVYTRALVRLHLVARRTHALKAAH